MRTTRVMLLAACAVSAVAGACATIILRTADLTNWGNFLVDFAKSPGLAALVALFAAILAFRGIRNQVEAARASLEQDSWWKMFEWASTQAGSGAQPSNSSLMSVAASAFSQLNKGATVEVQRIACSGMIDFVLGQTREDVTPQTLKGRVASDGSETAESESASVPAQEADLKSGSESGASGGFAPEPGGVWVPLPKAPRGVGGSSALDVIADYIDTYAGTSAVSGYAEAWAYENAVIRALGSIVEPGIKLWRNPMPSDGVDAIAEIDGTRVYVEILWATGPGSLRRMAKSRLSRSGDVPLLVVAPMLTDLASDLLQTSRALLVKFDIKDDPDVLVRALRDAAKL
jgi:hypothetical protein